MTKYAAPNNDKWINIATVFAPTRCKPWCVMPSAPWGSELVEYWKLSTVHWHMQCGINDNKQHHCLLHNNAGLTTRRHGTAHQWWCPLHWCLPILYTSCYCTMCIQKDKLSVRSPLLYAPVARLLVCVQLVYNCVLHSDKKKARLRGGYNGRLPPAKTPSPRGVLLHCQSLYLVLTSLMSLWLHLVVPTFSSHSEM